MVTDLFQFVLEDGDGDFARDSAPLTRWAGSIRLKTQITTLDAASGHAGSRLDFFPPLNSAWMPAITLCVYLAVNWWATWYPGAEPGGGGYVAQRIFSAKNERHGVLATLVVQRGALRAAAMALGYYGARDDRALSRR